MLKAKKYLVGLCSLFLLFGCTQPKSNNKQGTEDAVNLGVHVSGNYSAKSDKRADPMVSIYRDNLSSNGQSLYDAVVAGIPEFRNSYKLQTPLAKEEVQDVMAIVLLDNPDFFYVQPHYDYTLDEDGLVSDVKLEFTMVKAEVQAINKRLLTAVESNNDEVSWKFLFELMGDLDPEGFDPKPVPFSDFLSISPEGDTSVKRYSNQNMMKYYLYMLRRLGFSSSMVYGETLNTEYAGGSYDLGSVTDDGKRVAFDVSGMYSWLILYYDGFYYHFDPWMNAYFKAYIASGSTEDDELELVVNPYLAMNDAFASNSRKMFVNTTVLGMQPMANNQDYSSYSVGGSPFYGKNDFELKEYIVKTLKKGGAKTTRIVIPIVNSDYYPVATQGIDLIMKDLTVGNSKVSSYSYRLDPYAQLLIIENIILDVN